MTALLLALAAGCGREPDDAGHASHEPSGTPAESREQGSEGGGLVSLTLLTLVVIPALYVIWRERSLPRVEA